MAKHDLVVIGAGPGGYVAALRAAQLGMDVACIEKEPLLGGTCLRVGCIPSKALLESSERFAEARDDLGAHGVRIEGLSLDLAALMKRKQEVVRTLTQGVAGLLGKAKVTVHQGTATFVEPRRVEVRGSKGTATVEGRHVLIATGSKSALLPGVELDGDRVGTSTEALAWDAVPEHLVVIGAGYIGLELGSVWRRLGARVTVVEVAGCILPGMDSEIAKEAQRCFASQGLEFRLDTRVAGAKRDGDGARVELEGGETLACDRVLLATGRVPNVDDLGLEAIGLALDERGRIPVDEQFATPVDGVFAVGDCIRGPMLAHKASEEGVACVESLAGGHGHVDYGVIPGIVYTEPEVATVGKSEDELRDEGRDYRKGAFPFQANGRARALGRTHGKVKILADARTDRILGVHVVGPRAGDLIAEAVAAMAFGASSEDLARTCHAHPTLSEAVHEAALAVDRRALHI